MLWGEQKEALAWEDTPPLLLPLWPLATCCDVTVALFPYTVCTTMNYFLFSCELCGWYKKKTLMGNDLGCSVFLSSERCVCVCVDVRQIIWWVLCNRITKITEVFSNGSLAHQRDTVQTSSRFTNAFGILTWISMSELQILKTSLKYKQTTELEHQECFESILKKAFSSNISFSMTVLKSWSANHTA